MTRRHPYSDWNISPSTADRSSDPNDASNRIFDGFFVPQCLPEAPRIRREDPVFTMGSCFARELETILDRQKFTVSSLDKAALSNTELWGDSMKNTMGFFHRYNTPSMELEFRRALGDSDFREDKDLLIQLLSGAVLDLHYAPRLPRANREVVIARRAASRAIVERAKRAKAIIITLGLTEAWFHLPSKRYTNAVNGEALGRRRKEFELRKIGFEENLRSLNAILDCLKRKHETGDFTLFVTVSPVPIQNSFDEADIVVSNTRAKATLRAVADEFCSAHKQAIYFPSYEIAMQSNPAKVWRPDRVHINPECVRHIVSVFTNRYVEA
jgi:GSCFA family protein